MKVHILPYKDIFPQLLNFEYSQLSEYLAGGRQDVLDNTDIFCENVRSVSIPDNEKDFSLFQRVDNVDSNTVVVFPIYLELFEFTGSISNIYYAIDKYSKLYKDNKVVFFWNHDQDFAKYTDFVSQYENVRVINYNTSVRNDQNIIVPFWTMGDISELILPKKTMVSFYGGKTHVIRYRLSDSLSNRVSEGYEFSFNKLPYDEYRKKLSEAIFGLCPRGAGLSSYRFFECFHTGTIPILHADIVKLPYTEKIDYYQMMIHIPEVYTSFDSINNNVLGTMPKHNEMIKHIRENRWRFTLKGVQEYVYGRLV